MALAIVRKHFPKIVEVVDATEPIVIEVTKRDETASKRRDHEVCALAVACKRSEKLDGVIVSVGRAYLVKGTRATRYTMSQHAQREIIAFDRGGGFSAGAYTLNTPKAGARLGDRVERVHEAGNLDVAHKAKGVRRTYQYTEGIRTVLGGRRSA
jgi:hypothetical protein